MSTTGSSADRWIDAFITGIMLVVIAVCLYPLLYVFSMSISDPLAAAKLEVWLWPKGFSLQSYKLVMSNPDVWTAYGNTIFYTVVGTAVNVVVTLLIAYPLSRRSFVIRKPLTLFIVFTMLFKGGLIPTFILVNQLGLYNTRWILIVLGAVGVWYVIIARTFFESIPESLIESAKLDGASDMGILWRIIIPLAMPITAVLILFYAVEHWNSYFSALIYLPDKDLQPLQLYLVKVLVENTQSLADSVTMGEEKSLAIMQVKYAIIIVSTLPILFIYPFLQKYFIKGVMIGAIKG
ncbi:carbohydrate ABC transporter permease [Paenibacillus doosanensis]|uniref:L-arabinose transport system permease protein AraQ n=1 Tax=Paenibacillus konkukensis TaxID=2020716 RepID=A0ABY4RFA0_9BACL|nr:MULTISPECIES: carbohydrate ABC transporter permease [Paenibacillus]MCS7461327.1 carbohydrate ABC transporter permease [Paenibacillus doosanensis]UQZ81093.1 L-arabinose transport system permease protein AraQ [Paenibacillus konkukensis]